MAKTEFFKNNKKEIFVYIAIFIFMLLLFSAKIVQTINPFCFSFLFALVYLEKNGYILSVLYFISGIIVNFSFDNIIILLSTISVCVLLCLIYKCLKKKIGLLPSIIALLFSQTGFVYFNINSMEEIFSSIICLIVGILFFYVCIVALGALFSRGLQSKLTIDETICFSLILISCASGLQGLNIFGFSITNAIIVLLLLVVSRCFTKLETVYLSAILGIGLALSNGGVVSIAIFTLYGIICGAVCDKNRFIISACVCLLDIVLGLFFEVYVYYDILSFISVLTSCLLFLCLPQKIFDEIKGYSYTYDGKLINEFIVSGQKELLSQKLNKLSDLYKQMQISYRNLSIGEIDKSRVCEVLCEELIKNHCNNCPRINMCLENIKIKNGIEQLFQFCLEKEKVTIIDANNILTTECMSLSSLIAEVNQSTKNYFDYEKNIKTENANKMLIAEQLGGTGDLFKELSFLLSGKECINEKAGRVLIDELRINKVVVNEVVVLDGTNGIERVLMIVRNKDVLSGGINESLKSIFRLEFINVVRKMTRLAGWSILCFIPAPKYSLSVGFSYVAKDGDTSSGDTYSFTKISDTKMLFAIADGMGHGKRANEISTTAISLLENFYKSGFCNQTIISSINKLLLPSCEENFTTIDVCVVDTSNGTADFIKIGASVSVLKTKEGSSLISADSLPLGVANNITPIVQKKVLRCGDIIVIASDGVVDSFDNFEDYLCFVNNERFINSQMLADNIMEEVLSREKDHADDKTIITIKLNQFSKTN